MNYNYCGQSKTLGQWSKVFGLPISWFQRNIRFARQKGLNRNEAFGYAVRHMPGGQPTKDL